MSLEEEFYARVGVKIHIPKGQNPYIDPCEENYFRENMKRCQGEKCESYDKCSKKYGEKNDK